MAYRIVIEDPRIWKKDCDAIPHDRVIQILRKIRALEKEPWEASTQIKHLKDYPIADFRLRVGDYRVLFDKDETNKIVHLLRVMHRSKLY